MPTPRTPHDYATLAALLRGQRWHLQTKVERFYKELDYIFGEAIDYFAYIQNLRFLVKELEYIIETFTDEDDPVKTLLANLDEPEVAASENIGTPWWRSHQLNHMFLTWALGYTPKYPQYIINPGVY